MLHEQSHSWMVVRNEDMIIGVNAAVLMCRPLKTEVHGSSLNGCTPLFH